MSIKSKLRNEKRPSPTCRENSVPGLYKHYIRQKPQASFEELVKVKTTGAFGTCRINRKPRVPETVPLLDMTTA